VGHIQDVFNKISEDVFNKMQSHWFQKAASASDILGQGKVEAQVMGRVFVERHVPKSAGNVEADHPVVRLEQMM
jgi:hypothetical protein